MALGCGGRSRAEWKEHEERMGHEEGTVHAEYLLRWRAGSTWRTEQERKEHLKSASRCRKENAQIFMSVSGRKQRNGAVFMVVQVFSALNKDQDCISPTIPQLTRTERSRRE